MRQQVSFAFRTLLAPWLVVPALALEIANFLQRGMPWRGEGMWTVEWFAISLFIIGPLCTAAAAVDAARLSRPGNIHLVLSVPWPVLAYVRAAGWCAGPVVGVHLAAIVAGLVAGQVSVPGAGWGPMAAAAVIQCLAITWYVALGSLIGRFTSPLLAGLIGAAGAWLLFYPLSSSALGGPERFALLDMGASTVTQIGRTYHAGYLASQAAVFILTAALFLVVRLRTRSGTRIPTFGGMAAGLIAVVVLVSGQYVLPATRKVDVRVLPEFCRGTEPVVCLYDEHRRFYDEVAGDIETLSDAAREAGYSALALERVAETSRNYRPGGESDVVGLWLPAQMYERGEMSIQASAETLLKPRHCDQLRAPTPPPERYWWRLKSLTMTWLALAQVDYDPARFETPIGPAEVLEPAQAREIVDDFARCDLDGTE